MRAAAVVVALAVACGGSREVPHAQIRKTLLWRNPEVGSIAALLPAPSSVYVVGRDQTCQITLSGQTIRCGRIPVDDPVRKEGFFRPVGDGGVVADFDGDGSPDRLLSPSDDEYLIASTAGPILGRTTIDEDHWFEPAVSRTAPHRIFISTDHGLLVLDHRLHRVACLPTPGIQSPIHIRAAEPLPSGALVSLFGGKGRTTLFIHSPAGAIVATEVLPEDAEAILPLPSGERFLLGGRGTVWTCSLGR